MEQAIEFLSQYIPEAILTAIVTVFSILYIVMDVRVKLKGKLLHTTVKEKVTYIDSENKIIKERVDSRDTKTNTRIDELTRKIELLEKRQEKSENALVTLIEEDAE